MEYYLHSTEYIASGIMSETFSPELIAGFGVQLGITSQLYIGLMTRLVEPHDMTYPQFVLLLHLSRRSGPTRMSDMVQAVELTQSAVTKAVQKFAALGLAEVHKGRDDLRNRLVAITPQGRTRVGEVQRKFGPAFASMLEGWSAGDIARLTGDLARLSRWLQESAHPVDPAQ